MKLSKEEDNILHIHHSSEDFTMTKKGYHILPDDGFLKEKIHGIIDSENCLLDMKRELPRTGTLAVLWCIEG